jgi:hypothetical protein
MALRTKEEQKDKSKFFNQMSALVARPRAAFVAWLQGDQIFAIWVID